MPLVRSVEEFVEEEQFKYIAESELIEIKKIGESDQYHLLRTQNNH